MYSKDGVDYYVVDGHCHFWDASPANWVAGAEQYARGWIECFHAYQGLGPPETHWPMDKFQKYSEETMMHDGSRSATSTRRSFSPPTSRSGTSTGSTPSRPTGR